MNQFRAMRVAVNRRRRAARLLARVPDAIILSTASRDLNLSDWNTCLVASFVREELILIHEVAFSQTLATGQVYSVFERPPAAPPAGLTISDVPRQCALMFGGSSKDWDWLFHGVIQPKIAPAIERAFTDRVWDAVTAEAAGVESSEKF